MKKLGIAMVICITLILSGSVNTFGLVQLNLENTVNGSWNNAAYQELSLSGNVVIPLVGLKLEGEYDSGTAGDLKAEYYMVGAGFRLIKIAGISLFAGAEYLDSTIAGNKINVVFYDASLEWRITKSISIDAWVGKSLFAYYNGISSSGNQVFAYRTRLTYWFINNIGVSAGVRGSSFQTDIPWFSDDNFNGIYLGAAMRL